MATAVACAALASNPASAAASPDAAPEAPEADLNIQAQPSGQWTGLWTRQQMLGDMGGLRPWLGKYGVTFQLTETSEYLANLRGGLSRGGDYDGLTTATVQRVPKRRLACPAVCSTSAYCRSTVRT
jgi:porin